MSHGSNLTKDKITKIPKKEHKRLKVEFNRTSFKEMLRRIKGCRCQVCKSTDNVQYHHIVPLFLGGSNDLDNIIPLCSVCHAKAHGGQNMRVIASSGGGRKKKKPPKGYKVVLDRYFRCEIGKAECQEILGYTGSKINDVWWYKEYMNELGIVGFRNNIDIMLCKKNHQEIMPHQELGYVEYARGSREYFYSDAYLKAHKEYKQMSFV